MRMHNPPHPGGVLLRRWIEPLGISITQAAKHLGVFSQGPIRACARAHRGQLAVGLRYANPTYGLPAFQCLQGEGCVFTKR